MVMMLTALLIFIPSTNNNITTAVRIRINFVVLVT